MTTYCDFEEQAATDGIQPDLVVNLPERRAIVVDAKASTVAYLEASKADEPEAANAAWQKHAQPCGGRWMIWPAGTTARGWKVRWTLW